MEFSVSSKDLLMALQDCQIKRPNVVHIEVADNDNDSDWRNLYFSVSESGETPDYLFSEVCVLCKLNYQRFVIEPRLLIELRKSLINIPTQPIAVSITNSSISYKAHFVIK
jgi:hypothetical protein